jgi:hypothetical protein
VKIEEFNDLIALRFVIACKEEVHEMKIKLGALSELSFYAISPLK